MISAGNKGDDLIRAVNVAPANRPQVLIIAADDVRETIHLPNWSRHSSSTSAKAGGWS